MKVLLINSFFYRKGGSEAVFFNTAELLRQAGHEVIFLSYKRKENESCEQESFFIGRGGKIQQMRNFFSNHEAAKKLEKLIIAEKPDIAHAHLFWGGISPSIFAVLHKHCIPLVHTAHDYRMVCPAYLLKDGNGNFCERCKGGKFYNCALHRCSKGNLVESMLMTMEMYYRNRKWHPANEIDGIVFVSIFSKRKHVEFDKRFENAKTQVIYNCPSEMIKESLDIDSDTFESYYLYYGRLSEEKGVRTLLKAFEEFPLLKLKVVGTGSLEEELKRYCLDKALSNIEFLGYKTGKELFDLVAGAKYVCVPSECYENNPMTIVEAYSLTTPVIGAAIGGISEIINDGETGYLFESGNVESLVAAIGKASQLDRDAFQMQKNAAYRFAKENFSRERHLKKLLSFYERLLNKLG